MVDPRAAGDLDDRPRGLSRYRLQYRRAIIRADHGSVPARTLGGLVVIGNREVQNRVAPARTAGRPARWKEIRGARRVDLLNLSLESPEWRLVLPQLIVFITALVLLTADAFIPNERHF